jgi:hypothetical protein
VNPAVVEVKDGLRILLRDARPEDEAVIMRAWLVGFHKGGDWPRRVPKERYFREHKATVQRLLAKSLTIVACNPEREWQVLGFLCYSGPVLHWVYVKQMYRGERGMGVATAMWHTAWEPRVCSHWSRAAKSHLRSGWELQYDPFLLEVR